MYRAPSFGSHRHLAHTLCEPMQDFFFLNSATSAFLQGTHLQAYNNIPRMCMCCLLEWISLFYLARGGVEGGTFLLLYFKV